MGFPEPFNDLSGRYRYLVILLRQLKEAVWNKDGLSNIDPDFPEIDFFNKLHPDLIDAERILLKRYLEVKGRKDE